MAHTIRLYIVHAMGWRAARAAHYDIALLAKVYTDV